MLLLGAAVTAISARTTLDPGHRLPMPATAFLTIAIVALVVIGFRWHIPPATRTAPTPPAPAVMAASALAAAPFLIPLWLPGHLRWSFVEGAGVLPAMLVAIASAAVYGALLRGWGTLAGRTVAEPWTDLQTLAAATGLVIEVPQAVGDGAVVAALNDR